MGRHRVVAGAAAFITVALSVAVLAGQGGEIGWRTDYAKAREEARQEGKLLMLYFTAPW